MPWEEWAPSGRDAQHPGDYSRAPGAAHPPPSWAAPRSLTRGRAIQVGFGGTIMEVSKRGGAGFAAWLDWLRSEVAATRARPRSAGKAVHAEAAS